VFVFALRAYDRINKTPVLEDLEKQADVTYQDIQRGIAETIMSESVHPAVGKDGDDNEKDYAADQSAKEETLRKLQKFQEKVDQKKAGDGFNSKDSVAHCTMLNGGKVSDESWEGDPEAEKANFVQEELYVHGKVCIVDDRTIICGSANINDRVCYLPPPPQKKKTTKSLTSDAYAFISIFLVCIIS
jgi:phospholipase D1/2